MLRKDTKTGWTEECQKAFDKIKEYLSKPPVLVPLEPGRPLLLYFSVLDGSFGYVMGQHDETRIKEQAIYYLSKKFTPYKVWYSLLECTCCVMIWIAQTLRHAFYAYTTYLISRMDPLIFQKPMPTGKLAKWKILLSEYDIVYVIQKEVIGQTLADHLAESPVDGEYEPLKMYFFDEEVSFMGKEITEAYNGGVEAGSYKAGTKRVVAEFVRDCIVYRFRVPESIITDNAANISSDLMKAMCETFKIKHKNSTTYMPQMIGAVEVANKNIKKILRKMVDNYKQWHEKLPFALLGYCTTICKSIGETPTYWFYGTEVVIPAEVEIHSLGLIQEAELSGAEWVQR
ncbi:uncharacterized protein [Nicotiana tomentosiformis]|uniref:uncharacterized protein n=1 Tax=Nicotiana tomentosiformis TaxID=4098 RepID=UPI00388C8719